ncbi:hypothetical protein EVAR_3501_1 [Eumeta japonica]|uniref:Uncharacterized protein n=1 Tax=Eumeta variegata TaxID=151549 RepID=A0A4C1YX87_EUMVA|nr:hypothetical protein EVAR_3501_1 [Eumeta japonica]
MDIVYLVKETSRFLIYAGRVNKFKGTSASFVVLIENRSQLQISILPPRDLWPVAATRAPRWHKTMSHSSDVYENEAVFSVQRAKPPVQELVSLHLEICARNRIIKLYIDTRRDVIGYNGYVMKFYRARIDIFLSRDVPCQLQLRRAHPRAPLLAIDSRYDHYYIIRTHNTGNLIPDETIRDEPNKISCQGVTIREKKSACAVCAVAPRASAATCAHAVLLAISNDIVSRRGRRPSVLCLPSSK